MRGPACLSQVLATFQCTVAGVLWRSLLTYQPKSSIYSSPRGVGPGTWAGWEEAPVPPSPHS